MVIFRGEKPEQEVRGREISLGGECGKMSKYICFKVRYFHGHDEDGIKGARGERTDLHRISVDA